MKKLILVLLPLLLFAPLTTSPAAACENCPCEGMRGEEMSALLQQALRGGVGMDQPPALKVVRDAGVIKPETTVSNFASQVRRLLSAHQPMFMVGAWQ